MDVNKLLKALDDETNENLLNFTTKQIKEMNLKILKELHLSKNDTLDLLNKLGKFKMGKACIYVNRLIDIDLDVLKELCIATIKSHSS